MDEEKFRLELKELKEKEFAVRKSVRIVGQDGPGQSKSDSSNAMRYTWLGAEFAAIFIGFVWGGYTLDQRLDTKPWLILIGIAAGFGLALYRLIFVARRLSN